MSVGAISAGSLAQGVLTSSSIAQAQQAMQTLQTSLGAGDLEGAKSAFALVQQLNQNLTGSPSTGTSSQLTTDMTALGSALTAGDLTTAQSAFATVQNDLKSAPSPELANAMQAESQAVQLVDGFLSSMDTSGTSATTDATDEALQSAYGTGSILNVYA
jgi:hypothetical protein